MTPDPLPLTPDQLLLTPEPAVPASGPILLTPGPLTTSADTKSAMLSDWGSWDGSFNELTASVCRDLVAIVDAQDEHICVPLQGSGTFAVEAALGTLVPRGGKVLVPDNGSYCKRIVRILGYQGREAVVLPHGEQEPADPARIDAALAADPAITHVAQVHCETGTGILNPLPEIAAIVAKHGRGLIVDAMSSFAAIPIDARTLRFDALIAASGKCLEGVPGMGFIIARRADAGARRRQQRLAGHGSGRPVAIHAEDGAVALHAADACARRSARRHRSIPGAGRFAGPAVTLYRELRGAGLRHAGAGPQDLPAGCTTGADHRHFPLAARSGLRFQRSSIDRVRDRGFILYPGKLTAVDTFRVGCIGAIGPSTLKQAVAAVSDVLREMGVRRFA